MVPSKPEQTGRLDRWRAGISGSSCYIVLMAKFEKHIFICGNQRPPGHPRGCCDPSAQAELQKLFKQKLAKRGLKGKVRANQSGCLDQCEHGPNLVVYPEAVWYGRVTLADVDEIIQSHIVGGKPVERLMLRDSCINTASCEHKPRPDLPSKNL
jgi:(2Fe-2S) ferredoxin